MLELKIAFMEILRKFNFARAPETVVRIFSLLLQCDSLLPIACIYGSY